MNLEELREDYLRLVAQFGQLEAQIRVEITEYRKTVNTALSLLSKELMDFIDRDVAERKARQRRQDYKDIALGSIGCLVVAFGCILIGLLVWQIWRI